MALQRVCHLSSSHFLCPWLQKQMLFSPRTSSRLLGWRMLIPSSAVPQKTKCFSHFSRVKAAATVPGPHKTTAQSRTLAGAPITSPYCWDQGTTSAHHCLSEFRVCPSTVERSHPSHFPNTHCVISLLPFWDLHPLLVNTNTSAESEAAEESLVLSSPSSWCGLYQEPLTLLLAIVFQSSVSSFPHRPTRNLIPKAP